VSPDVARLALRCQESRSDRSVPDLLVTSRRVAPFGAKTEDHLDIVREAVGERLVRLVSDLTCEAAFQEKPPERVEVMRGDRFSKDINRELIVDLGLSPKKAVEFSAFEAALARDFRVWLRANQKARGLMRGEFEGDMLFIRCPLVRRWSRPK
jgi:hypothetical protein